MEQLKCNVSEKVRDCLMSPICSPEREKQTESPLSAIAASHQESKKTTSQDKSCSCGKDSQTQKSSKTSEAVLTTKEKDCNPFYNDFCKEISSQLLSHIEIDCAGSDLNLLNSSCSKTVGKSWFSIEPKYHHNENSQRTCWQYFTYFHAGCMDFVDTRIKSRKIRIYPTQEQKHLFRKWFGVSRKVYNTSVEYYNDENKSTIKWMEVSKIVLNSLPEDYVKVVPYQIKKIAIKDCYTAFRVGCKKAKETGEGFEFSFRTRKNPKQSCYIPKSALSDQGIYYTLSGTLKMKERHLLENSNWQDLRLVCEYGRWYISVPIQVHSDFQVDNQNLKDVVALDPGIRAFLTYFSEEGRFGKIGEGCFKRLLAINHKIAKPISKKDLEKDKYKRRRLYRKIGKLRLQLHDITDELHWKTINFLTRNFGVILLPTFETSEMIKKDGRKINEEVVKAMQSFRFYVFGERLKQKSEERGVVLLRTNEAYTSKTNSFNGEIMNIGSRKSFKYDGIKIDRDVNGARNILLRAMRDSSATAEMPCVD